MLKSFSLRFFTLLNFLTLLCVCSGAHAQSQAQNNLILRQYLGIGTTSVPAASSALQIDSTTKGFVPPRMTSTQRDAMSSPLAGNLIWNSTTGILNVWDGDSWELVGGINPVTANRVLVSDGSGNLSASSVTTTDLSQSFLDITELFSRAVPSGGSTGQVLSKVSGTDYDMSWVPDVGFANPMTTNGDLITRTAGVPARLGIGATNQFLSSSGTAPEWITTLAIANGGTGQTTANLGFNALSPMTTNGDIITRAAGISARLGIGTTGQVLTVENTGLPAWKAAAGGGSKNYLGTINGANNNGDLELGATTGWTLGTTGTLTNGIPTGTPTFGSGASGNLSLSMITSASQLSGTWSLGYNSSAATTVGNMVASSAFSLDKSDRAKMMTVTFRYEAALNPTNANWSGTSSNSYAWAVWDATNSSWIPPTGGFCMTQSSGTGICTGNFQTSASGASYRFVVYNANATTGAANVTFDDFFLGPQTAPIGAVSSDFVSYTPTFAGMGTPTTINVGYSRDGDSLIIKGSWVNGTVTATTASMSLPPGLTIDTGKVAVLQVLGTAQRSTSNVAGLTILGTGGGSVLQFGVIANAGGSANVAGLGNVVMASTEAIYVNARIPISGWSSNVQLSNDTDTRVVSFTGTQSSQAVTANVTNITFTATKDSHAAWNGTQFVVPVSGDYVVGGSLVTNTSSVTGVPFVDGTAHPSLWATSGGSGTVTSGLALLSNLKAGQLVSLRLNASATVSSGAISIFRLSGPSVVAASESVRAIYQTAAGQSIPNSTATTVVFGTRIKDTHNSMNSGTGVYTCPVSGGFRVSVSLYWSTAIVATATDVQIQVFKNGALYLGNNNPKSGTASVPITVSGSFPVDCNAGDTIEVRALQNTGSAQTLLTNAAYNWVSIERVGN